MEQGSEDWLKMRKKKVTATDAVTLMGLSPWATPYQLWQRKMDLIPEQQENDAMRRGKELEIVARDKFNEQLGLDMQPAVIVNPDLHWQMASLDGYNEKTNEFMEIKCSTGEIHHAVKCQRIPNIYVPQIVHQFMCTKSKRMFFISYYPYDNHAPLVSLEVSLDNVMDMFDFATLMTKEKEFYRQMNEFDPPELCDRDYQIINSPDAQVTVDRWKYAQAQRKIHEKEEEMLRLQIIGMCNNQSSLCSGVKIKKIPRRGNIEWNKIPEIQNVDTEKYRKSPSDTWRLTEE